MSDTNNAGLLEQMRQQHQGYCQQRDQAQVNFQQLQGAIFACEQMIAKLHEDEQKALEGAPQQEEPSKGDASDDQVIEQSEEQAA